METIAVVLMGIALFLLPIWLLISFIFAKNSIYPQKREWIIIALGVAVLVCFTVSVILGLIS